MRAMRAYAQKVVGYKETIKKYYCLLSPGQKKLTIYWEGLVGIENILIEVERTIHEHEINYPVFMEYMKNSKELKRLEYQLESIEHRCSRIEEMYKEAKERV